MCVNFLPSDVLHSYYEESNLKLTAKFVANEILLSILTHLSLKKNGTQEKMRSEGYVSLYRDVQ